MTEQSPDSPFIVIAGLARVGSMWSFNVARSLFREAGLRVIPEQVPKMDQAMAEVANAYMKSSPPNTRCVIKVHSKIKMLPDFRVIRNQRDMHDRLFSFCRFMQIDFDRKYMLDQVAACMDVESYYDQWPADQMLNIPYESIETDSRSLIRKIAEFIGYPDVDEQVIRKIDTQYSKQQVKSKIAELESQVFDADGNVNVDIHPDAVIGPEDDPSRARAFDVGSGFQSGHVSSYQPGDWKNRWTFRQRWIVNSAIRKVRRDRKRHGL